MRPDFSAKTIDILAKRAAYRCSNPDCNATTIGPNSSSIKATLVGEAAHIYGARPNSKRFKQEMSDTARAEITNAIWLCRNCHKKIDSDQGLFTADLLFRWREHHEREITLSIGKSSEKINLELLTAQLRPFENYPAIIKRVITDKPRGWEFRLAAELIRYLNEPLFKRLEDLREGLYLRPPEHIYIDTFAHWLGERTNEMGHLLDPIGKILDRLSDSFGEIGVAGNVEEIHHNCLLLKDIVSQVIDHEERLFFVFVPDGFEEPLELLKGTLTSQIEKLRTIPDILENNLKLAEENEKRESDNGPLIVEENIVFELPHDFVEKYHAAIERIADKM